EKMFDHLEDMEDSRLRMIDKIFDRVDTWHYTHGTITLAAFLGWSDEEYKAFVARLEIPEREYE
ncbi:MAG: hypothetical protein V3T23_03880, partial [Nitrososphaerales archaeon]